MPVDIESNRLAWFNSGLNTAKFASEGFNLGLQKQARASQAADRQIRERQLAAQIAQIDLENQKLSAEIQQRAAADAEMLNVNTQFKKEVTAFEAARDAGFQGPEEEPLRHAARLSAQLAPTNPRTLELNQKLSTIEAARALAEQRGTSDLEAEAQRALIRQRDTASDLNETRRLDVGKSGTGTLPELEKIFSAADKDGTPFTPKAKQQAREIHLGLQSKPGTEAKVVSKPAYVAKNLSAFMPNARKKVEEKNWRGKIEVVKVSMTEDEAIDALGQQYDRIFGGGGSESAAQPAAPTASPTRISVKDSSGKVVGTIPDTPSQRKLATDKGLFPVQ